MFANHVSVKGLVFRIQKKLSKVNDKKQPTKKMSANMEWTLHPVDMQMANEHMEKNLVIISYYENISESQLDTSLHIELSKTKRT